MKHPALIDVAVLILFFNRPDALAQVFEQVKKARPSRLFLYQDGARNEKDREKMEACRKIVADIDWECEVHHLYQEKNYGCDPSEFISQKWAFSIVDKCIVLEDDDVPSVSFFTFCKEMLDKYEYDPRISIISGLNYDEVTPDMPYDYFFAKTFSISGWASWRRVIDQWDEHYTFLEDDFNLRQMQSYIKANRLRSDFIETCRYHKRTGKAYYETIFQAAIFLQHGLSIVPRQNMIRNLGASGDGVHVSGSNDDFPQAIREIFEMQCHEISFPLNHPPYIIENTDYKVRTYKRMAWGHPWRKIKYSMEELYINLRKGNFQRIGTSLRNRVRKLLGRQRYD